MVLMLLAASKMNTVFFSAAVDNGVYGSDSDYEDLPKHYHPISTADDSGEEEGDHFHHLSKGLSSLDLSDDDREDDEKEEEEEEEATKPERTMEHAFRDDDERRHTAPLTEDNTARVMEAMHQISFGGAAPDWAGLVPEDRFEKAIQLMIWF